MANNGKARVLTDDEWDTLFSEIERRRHPEKNAAIMRISRNLGLRAQEIALLKMKDVVKLDARFGQTHRQFTLYKVLTVPANITKGANALRTSTSTYQRKSLTFSVAAFDNTVAQIAALAKTGEDVDPSLFYPPVNKQRKGIGRDLPLASDVLRDVLVRYVQHRLDTDLYVKPTDPLFLSQRKRFYSPNSLQEHMAMMLRGWAGVEKAKSHSGRRGVATTVIYEQLPEGQKADALKEIGKQAK